MFKALSEYFNFPSEIETNGIRFSPRLKESNGIIVPCLGAETKKLCYKVHEKGGSNVE
jgi:hypothetical protein